MSELSVEVRNTFNHIPQPQKDLMGELRAIINKYLKDHPRLSVNSLSAKCAVSEPTLRRILAGRVKTVPMVTTVLDILCHIEKTTSVREVIERHPGPVADFLLESLPHVKDFDHEYSDALNKELRDPIKYLIFKLSLNHVGVSENKIIDLYGTHGLRLLEEMVAKGFVEKKESCRYFAKMKSFTSRHEDFVRNFKLVSDFIKPDKHRNRKKGNPFFANYSESISIEAYDKIFRLQKKTNKKIREILKEEGALGDIPFFYLSALDSLDLKAAWELTEEK